MLLEVSQKLGLKKLDDKVLAESSRGCQVRIGPRNKFHHYEILKEKIHVV